MIYYSGHGVGKDNVTWAVLNDPERPLYPIENMVRHLSKISDGYVIALLDCCRALWKPERFRGVD